MTEVSTVQPPYSVCATVALILFAAWIATHALHDRRLKRFGDPQLLGLEGMWPRRICSGILLVGAAGAMFALVAAAGAGSLVPAEGSGRVVFLVDPPGRSPGTGYGEQVWEGFSRDLRQVVEIIRPERVAFYLTGLPPRMVVPSTKDVPAALLVLEAESPGYNASNAGALEASVGAVRLMSSRAGTEAASAVIVVSPKAEAELDAVGNSFQPGPPVMFVRSTQGSGSLAYRREGPGAQWVSLGVPDSLKAFAGNMLRANERTGWRATQVLALAAFLLLYLEWAFRLSLCAGREIARRVLQNPELHDNGAGGRPRVGVALCLVILTIFVAARHATASQSGRGGDVSHRVAIEAIGTHAAILTEVSDEEPYVGQQFSVVYKLRCSIPPVAVDVDPQDFAGFWAVPAQTTGQARPEPVTLNGRAATDFLLRQLIVFPLKPGRLVLPPLRLKIKQDANSRDDWDLTSHTHPLEVRVRPVPGAGDSRDAFFMVGMLEANVSREDSGKPHEAVLEVEGTANLDFFRPEQWIRGRDGQPVRARLKDAESLVQTRDYGGSRRLTLLQRQRWTLSPVTGESGVALKSMSIPVFDPEASRWRSVEIPAFEAPLDASQVRDPHRFTGSPQRRLGSGIRFLTPVTVAFTISCLALLAVIFTGRLRRSG